jgi:hypothetical protein
VSPPPAPELDAEVDVTPTAVVADPPPTLEPLDPPVPSEVCPGPAGVPQATATTVATTEAAQGASETSCWRVRDPESMMAMVAPVKLISIETTAPAGGVPVLDVR